MVQGIGAGLGAMFIGLFIGGLLIMAAVTTLVLVIMKLMGVLLISWWLVLGIMPAVLGALGLLLALYVGLGQIFSNG